MPAVWSILIFRSVRNWVLSLGGPGLIVVGLVDNSVIPIPGGMDVFTILLTAHHREHWLYYGLMATVGAVIGGYVTYRLAKKGGKAELEKKVGKERAEKVYKKFEKGGFVSVLVGSVIPPPFPLVPVLMAAGVLQYSRKKFLSALSIGRGVLFLRLLSGTTLWNANHGMVEPLLQTIPVHADRAWHCGRYRSLVVLQMVSAQASSQRRTCSVRASGRSITLVICTPAA